MSFQVLRPIKDAYITDRVVNGTAQVSANVGAAGSLDLFKLYGVTTYGSGTYSSGSYVSGSFVPSGVITTTQLPNTELSRLLVQFDLNPLREELACGRVDITNQSFTCRLHLHDVYGGQPTPNNFTVYVYPLSSSFDEGLGRDVVFYSDSDDCNWLSSSWASGSWLAPGCGLGGDGSQPCDYITCSIGGSSSYLASQFFPRGTEDLDVDITSIVSATLAGLLPDAGLRISYVSSMEGDQHTYFVKRFASRTAFNDNLRPRIDVRFDSSIQDDTLDACLDATNYLFLYNYARSSLANITSGSLRAPVTGTNCMVLWLDGEFPTQAQQVVSSTVALQSNTPFSFPSSSNLTFNGTFNFVSQSVVYPPGVVAFSLNPGSYFGYVGTFVSNTDPRYQGYATNDLCSGTISYGTFIAPDPGIMSGTFIITVPNDDPRDDQVVRVIAGSTANFVGTIADPNANPEIDSYTLGAGFFVPFDPSSFSSSYVMSSTYVDATISDAQLVGTLFGTVPDADPEILSGSFYLADGVTPALGGLMTFSGTLTSASNGSTGWQCMPVPSSSIMDVGLIGLTGTIVPSGPCTFSGSYTVSSTLGPVDYVLGPFSASQHYSGINPQVGIYSASVFIPSDDPNLLAQWQFSGSITVIPIWGSLDGTVGYLTGSAFKIYAPQRGSRSQAPKELNISILGLDDVIDEDQRTILRVNIFDYTEPYLLSAVKLPAELPGIVIRDVFYQVRDLATDRAAVPFDTRTNSTRVSNDDAGMYFELDARALTCGHSYVIDILVDTSNNRQLYKAASAAFRVDASH